MSGAAAGRKALGLAVLGCVAGAGLALFAASRGWTTVITHRVAPLPPLSTVRTGGDLIPWLPAGALVALAGAGALIATRGIARLAVGGLLVLAGLAVAAAGVRAVAGGVPLGWPALCVAGGGLIVAAGIGAARRGRSWPGLGSRYERAPGEATPSGGPKSDSPDPRRSGEGGGAAAATPSAELWDALDRGDDPTR